MISRVLYHLFLLVLLSSSCHNTQDLIIKDDRFHIKVIDLTKQKLQLYWLDQDNKPIETFEQLNMHVKQQDKRLVYAMNAGMYLKDHSPQGLYIENGTIHKQLDTVTVGYGNFYLQPNGVFYLTQDGKAQVTATPQLSNFSNITYATQSGPMLVINDTIHPAFNKGSKNVHIRNAVGILPDGRILLAISKEKINFYDFATFFKNQGCKNALYLDGFVSRIYDPTINVEQMDGHFGVMIGVSD
ncbi:periplasmic protein [Flavobacteria bacterium BBFL7]|nr:periplasmic protein [Flavobacteria bacterium BBFL7]